MEVDNDPAVGEKRKADEGKARELLWKSLSWRGPLWPTTVDDAWAPAIWQTFFTSPLGLEVPVLSSLPRHHNLPAAKCGCKKFFARRSRRPHQHLHSSLRRPQGTRLDGGPPRPAIPPQVTGFGRSMVSRPAPRIGRNAVTLRSSTTCKTPLGAVTWFPTSP